MSLSADAVSAALASTAAARAVDVDIESPAKAYYSPATSGAATPLGMKDASFSYPGTPAASLDARLASLNAGDYFRRGTVHDGPGLNGREAGNPLAASTSTPDPTKARGALNWIKANQRFLACLWSIGTSGWSDACLGALLPFIQTHYRIGYKVASVLFLAACIGYILATCTTNFLTTKLGRGKVIALGAAIQVLGYSVMVAGPPFPLLPVGWIIVAYGAATQLAQTNSYAASMPNPHQALGSLHGAYGFGGAASPLVATAFVSAGIRFSYFFSVSLAFAALNVAILVATFRLKRDEESALDRVAGEELTAVRHRSSTPGTGLDGAVEAGDASVSHTPHRSQSPLLESRDAASLLEVLSVRTVLVMSFFLMLYCGAEVAIGGWIVTFLREDLGGTNAVGYAATGFWLGISLGRIILPRFNILVGERRVVYLYLAAALAFEMVVWFSRNLYAAAVCTSLVGFVIGPFFPNAISLGTKLIPKRLHMGAIAIFACLGSCGNALFPFMTGMLASVYGIWVLQPMVVSLLVGMVAMWSFLPAIDRRRE